MSATEDETRRGSDRASGLVAAAQRRRPWGSV